MNKAFTIVTARQKREAAEAEILAILKRLQTETGLDVIRVEVFTVVGATLHEDEIQRSAHAVRIDLAV